MNVKELLCKWISYYIKKDLEQDDNASNNEQNMNSCKNKVEQNEM